MANQNEFEKGTVFHVKNYGIKKTNKTERLFLTKTNRLGIIAHGKNYFSKETIISLQDG